MNGARVVGAAVLFGLVAASAAAQDPPAPLADRLFLFSVSAPPADAPHASVQLDSGFGDRAFDLTDSDRSEQRFGIQAFLGRRVTLVARVGISTDERDARSSQQGE